MSCNHPEHCERCAELMEKLDQLEWLSATLDEIEDFKIAVPVHLTRQEKRVLRAMMTASRGGRVASHEFLEDIIPSETEDPRRLTSIYVSRLRCLLKPFNVEIASVWGIGYQIPAASLEILKFEEE